MHHWVYQQGATELSQSLADRMKEYDPRTVTIPAPTQSAMYADSPSFPY